MSRQCKVIKNTNYSDQERSLQSQYKILYIKETTDMHTVVCVRKGGIVCSFWFDIICIDFKRRELSGSELFVL